MSAAEVPVMTAPEDTSPAESETVASGAGAEPNPMDFENRFKSDPDWALTEFKRTQGELSRRINDEKKYERVHQVVDSLGGPQGLFDNLNRLNALVSNPAMSQVVNSYWQTGTVPTVAATDPPADVSWQSPEERKIAELERNNQMLEQRITSFETRNAKSDITGHLDRFFKEHSYLEPDKGEILDGIRNAIGVLETTPQGRETIRNMTYENIQFIAANQILPRVEAIGRRAYEQSLATKRAASTEVAPSIQTNGREIPVYKGSAKDIALAALNDYSARTGAKY